MPVTGFPPGPLQKTARAWPTRCPPVHRTAIGKQPSRIGTPIAVWDSHPADRDSHPALGHPFVWDSHRRLGHPSPEWDSHPRIGTVIRSGHPSPRWTPIARFGTPIPRIGTAISSRRWVSLMRGPGGCPNAGCQGRAVWDSHPANRDSHPGNGTPIPVRTAIRVFSGTPIPVGTAIRVVSGTAIPSWDSHSGCFGDTHSSFGIPLGTPIPLGQPSHLADGCP